MSEDLQPIREGGAAVQQSICKLKSRLSDVIEPNFGLLDQLVSLGVLSHRQRTKVRSDHRSVYDRSDAILDFLTTSDQCEKFLTALERTGQQHVVNFIISDGEAEAEYGEDRPLDEGRLRVLDFNQPRLVELLDPDTVFIAELARSGCITWAQRDVIRDTEITRDKNEKLLDFLRRRSVGHYNKFVDIIAGGSQAFLASLFSMQSLLLAMDAELDETSVDDVGLTEDRIVSQWKDTLSADVRADIRESLDRVDEIVRPLGLQTRIVVLDRHNSIAMFIVCDVLEALSNLRHLWDTGQLRTVFEELFTLLTLASQPVRIKRLSWPLSDYQRCVNYFNSQIADEHLKKPAMLDLPLEMLEVVLMKSFMKLFKSDKERTTETAERETFITVASVCSTWRQTLIGWPQSSTSHWLKHRLLNRLNHICRPLGRHCKETATTDIGDVLVMGVARLDDVLYVVCAKSSTVRAFSAVSLQPLKSIEVRGLKSPWDIVACPDTRQLYVVDYVTQVVWRVSPALDQWHKHHTSLEVDQQISLDTRLHHELQYEEWIKTEMEGYIIKLSVTEGQLIVCCSAVGGERRVLQFVCKDRQLLRDVQLVSRDHDVIYIGHVILIRDPETFVALYMYQSRDVRRFELGQFDVISGQQLTKSDFSWTSSGVYWGGDHMTTVGDEGHLLVTDMCNHRVLEFNSTLQLQRVLLTTPRLAIYGPVRLCYHDGLLHVAYNRRRLSTYSLTLADLLSRKKSVK